MPFWSNQRLPQAANRAGLCWTSLVAWSLCGPDATQPQSPSFKSELLASSLASADFCIASACAGVTALLTAHCDVLRYVSGATSGSSRATVLVQDMSEDGDGAAMPLTKLAQHGILIGPGHTRYRSDRHVCTRRRRGRRSIGPRPRTELQVGREVGARTFHFRDDASALGAALSTCIGRAPLSIVRHVQPLGRAAAGPVTGETAPPSAMDEVGSFLVSGLAVL